MYILNIILLSTLLIYFYIVFYVVFKNNVKIPTSLYVVPYFIIINCFALTTLKDIYYFYLLYKLTNIAIYVLLIDLSNQTLNSKSLVYHYFLSFVSSLVFITSLYNITGNIISYVLINVAILIKLSIYPINNIIAAIYKKSNFLMFLTLSYLNNFYYIYILYIYNTAFQPFSQEFTNTLILSTIIPFLCFSTIFSSIYNFGKQGELKGFVAYSSIMNTPFIIVILLGGSRQISYELYDISITILFWYLIIYGINFILLSSVSINLEPIEGKK